MTDSSAERSRTVSILGREFKMRLLRFSNGCFLSISEGVEERIGSLMLSLKTHDKVEHIAVIPERRAEVFASILAETAASLTEGVSVVSLFVLNTLDAESARGLLGEVRDLLRS